MADIVSKPLSKEGEQTWERVFGKKEDNEKKEKENADILEKARLDGKFIRLAKCNHAPSKADGKCRICGVQVY